MPASRVNDDQFEALFFEPLNAFLCELNRIFGFGVTEKSYANLLAKLTELFIRSRAEGVRADDANFET